MIKAIEESQLQSLRVPEKGFLGRLGHQDVFFSQPANLFSSSAMSWGEWAWIWVKPTELSLLNSNDPLLRIQV